MGYRESKHDQEYHIVGLFWVLKYFWPPLCIWVEISTNTLDNFWTLIIAFHLKSHLAFSSPKHICPSSCWNMIYSYFKGQYKRDVSPLLLFFVDVVAFIYLFTTIFFILINLYIYIYIFFFFFFIILLLWWWLWLLLLLFFFFLGGGMMILRIYSCQTHSEGRAPSISQWLYTSLETAKFWGLL